MSALRSELLRLLPCVDHQCALMGKRLVLSEWKLRAAGADDALIAELRAVREIGS